MVTEGSVDRRPGILEGVVRVGLVAVDDPHTLPAVVGVDDEVADEGEVSGADALLEHPHRVTVPGQLAVVVAGQDDDRMIVAGRELGHRRGELRMGVEDAAHVGRTGQHLEAVAGDDEDAGPGPLVQDPGDVVGHGRRVVGGHHR